jgi:short subunit dehydrogenase-like uncharacterized protein
MASTNSAVVRRSNALLGDLYGGDFRYTECMGFTPDWQGALQAVAVSASLGLLTLALAVAPLRRVLAGLAPRPGSGPSQATRERGRFTMTLVGVGATTLRATVEGRQDPGHGETSKMLAESAVCLARDQGPDKAPGGVLTPAAAMGHRLMERLRAAGLRFTVLGE